MLKDLFKPKVIRDSVYHFKIGYQNILVFELNQYKENLIFNKKLNKILGNLLNLDYKIYFFSSFEEMEEDLDELITNLYEDYIVIIN